MDIRSIVANAFGAALAQKATPELTRRLAYAVTGYGRENAAPPEAVTLSFAVQGGGAAPAPAVRRRALALAGVGYGDIECDDDRDGLESDLPGREEKIRRRRTEFEELSRGVVSYLRIKLDEREPESLLQTSWLAAAARMPLALEVLPEVARDPAIEAIDASRLIWREINRTVPVVRAPRYRSLYETSGVDVVVAVIDGEVLIDAHLFGDRVHRRRNFTTEEWGVADDHATSVAGVIGANADQHVGMAQGAILYNYKLFPSKGPQDEFRGFLALQLAAEENCKVANCSWGLSDPTDGTSLTAKACDAAWELNMTVVKSAGNRGPTQGSVTSPADAHGVIVVGATDINGTKIVSYSSRGPTANGLARPHLVAPGGEPMDPVVSCLASGQIGSCGYGTSLAAPHVTGAIALLIGGEGEMTSEEQLARLESMCEPLPGHTSEEQGAGYLFTARGDGRQVSVREAFA